MNTADRSIAAIDTALRRRFTFIEMMPDYTALKNTDGTPIEVEGVNIAKMLEIMNRRIEVLYDREHTIGHAYFMASFTSFAEVFFIGSHLACYKLRQPYFFLLIVAENKANFAVINGQD